MMEIYLKAFEEVALSSMNFSIWQNSCSPHILTEENNNGLKAGEDTKISSSALSQQV